MKIKRQRKVFYFKKFSVHHDRCTMKVGTDAVLLGAWGDVSNVKHILDVGTGSGVIALMFAQRTPDEVQLDAIEIEEKDAEQAIENVMNSPWPKKILVHQTSFQNFEPDKHYDLIVSNPPYFVNSLKSPNQSRTRARHTHGLSFGELITHSLRLLKPNGRLAIILPFEEGNIFKSLAQEKKLHLIRETAFYSRKEKPQERWLLEFALTPGAMQRNELILYESAEKKSNAYVALTNIFYIDQYSD